MTFRNPFLRIAADLHVRRAQAVKAAEVELLGAIATGEVTEVDGGCSPLTAAIREHHGTDSLEMNRGWVLTPQNWRCPCCRRSKFEISRVAPESGRIVCKLVVHHDHMGEALRAAFREAYIRAGRGEQEQAGFALAERMGRAWAAHEDVLICEDCNNADSRAKKQVQANKFFSFSPNQVRTFIMPAAHKVHEIDTAAVERVWSSARPALQRRLALIGEVARAAASDEHWYEPFAGPGAADPSRHDGLTEELIKQLTPTLTVVRDLTRWRDGRWTPTKPLPSNATGLLLSDKRMAKGWSDAGDLWRCQCCERSREETIGWTKSGAVSFVAHSTSPARGWFQGGRSICSECVRLMQGLRNEVSARLKSKPSHSYGFVSIDEVRGVFWAAPNERHRVRPAEAAALVELCVGRGIRWSSR